MPKHISTSSTRPSSAAATVVELQVEPSRAPSCAGVKVGTSVQGASGASFTVRKRPIPFAGWCLASARRRDGDRSKVLLKVFPNGAAAAAEYAVQRLAEASGCAPLTFDMAEAPVAFIAMDAQQGSPLLELGGGPLPEALQKEVVRAYSALDDLGLDYNSGNLANLTIDAPHGIVVLCDYSEAREGARASAHVSINTLAAALLVHASRATKIVPHAMAHLAADVNIAAATRDGLSRALESSGHAASIPVAVDPAADPRVERRLVRQMRANMRAVGHLAADDRDEVAQETKLLTIAKSIMRKAYALGLPVAMLGLAFIASTMPPETALAASQGFGNSTALGPGPLLPHFHGGGAHKDHKEDHKALRARQNRGDT